MTSPFTAKRIRVPGLLPDDALQEQLRQYSTQQKQSTNLAPPSTSALDFADKVNSFVLNPPPAVRKSVMNLVSPPPNTPETRAARRAAQDDTIEQRSDALAGSRLARNIILGPVLGPVSEIAEQLGTLTAEESQTATEERAADLRRQEDAFKAKAEMRAKLRGLTDEQADQMGLPTGPGLRATPEELNELAAQDAAAVEAVGEKRRVAELGAAGKPGGQRVTQTWWLNAFQSAAKSAGQTATGALKSPVILLEGAADFVGGNGERSDVRAWLDTVDKTLDKMLPGDKARDKDFLTLLASGTGSMTAFLTAGFVASAAGLPPGLAIGTLGAASESSQMYQEAEQFSASALQRWTAFMLGAGIGATEAIPLDRMFMRADQATGGLVRKMLVTTRANSLEEFIQEVSQAIGEDITAKYLAGYDPDREIDVQDILRRGAVGALTGAAAGAAIHAVTEGRERSSTLEREAAAQGAIADAQAIFDRIEGARDDSLPMPPREQTVGADAGAPEGRPPVPAPLYMRADTPLGEIAAQLAQTEGGVELRLGDQQQQEPAQQYRGGTPPVLGDDGLVELTHFSRLPLTTIDPAMRGTGPLRGEERRRIGDRAGAPDVVDRSYYGVATGDMSMVPDWSDFSRDYEAKNPPPKTGKRRYEEEKRNAYNRELDRRGYPGEGLGPYRHTVRVDPNELYNWHEDPLKLWNTIPDVEVEDGMRFPITFPQRVTRMEKLIHDAGFKGIYFNRSPLGQTAVMFDQRQPDQIIDERTGQPVERPEERAAEQAYAMTAPDDADMQKLPGLPANSTGPIERVVHAAQAYAESRGIPLRRQKEYVKVDVERAKRIAQAYEQMEDNPNDPAVAASYEALVEETLAQYQFVKASGLKIDFIEQGQEDPYAGDLKKVLRDIDSGHLWVFPTDQGFGSLSEAQAANPLLRPTDEYIGDRQLLANDVFRIVHDFFGHGLEGSGFGARGEENAWQSHMRLFSEAAVPALTSETRGQNSWVNYGPYGEQNRANPGETVFADQKTGLMPEWTWREGVEDERTGQRAPVAATPADFTRLTPEVLEQPGWAIVTAMKEDAGDHTSPVNAEALARMRKEFKGTDAIEIEGAYKGVPQGASWVIFANEAAALEIGQRYGQESILTNRGLVYTDGRLVPSVPADTIVGDAARQLDFYSTLPDGTSFSVGLDFENMQQPGLADRHDAMFAGEDAETVDSIGLNQAINMRDEGRSPEDIWMATGFFLGADGRWRFEITDRDAKFTPAALKDLNRGSSNGYALHEALHHPKLFDAYPQLRGVHVFLVPRDVNGGASGQFDEANGSITVRAKDPTKMMSTLLHEVQHAIQALEGFARGGNLAMGELYEGDNVDAFRQRLREAEDLYRQGEIGLSVLNSWREGLRQAAAYEYYHRIAGEVEARNVQKRFAAMREAADMSLQGIQLEPAFLTPPPQTKDVPRLDQIIVARSVAGMGFESMSASPQEAEAARAAGTSAARPTYKGEQTRPAGGIPQQAGQQANDANLAQISRNFIQLLNLAVRQGRFTLKGANVMGQYSRRQAVARLRTWNDLSTLVHEGGHAFHDMMEGPLAAFTKANEKALMDVADKLYGRGTLDTAKLPRADHIREGFAELFRVYTLNRAYAVREFPQLTADFDAVLRREAPGVHAGLAVVGQQFAAYLQLPSVQALGNTIVDGRREIGVNAAIQELRQVGFKSWMREYARRGVQASVNRYAALNSVVSDMLNIGQENLNRPIDLKRAEDPRTLVRLAPNAGSRAMVQLTDGVMGYKSLQPATRGLRDAIMVSQGLDPKSSPRAFDENRLHDFETYLVALRALDEYRRYDEGKLSRPPINLAVGDVRQTIVDLTAKYGEAFEKGAQIVNDFALGLWKKQYDAGLMSKDVYEAGLDRRFYVPLQRDMSDKAGDFAPSALTGGRSLVRKFRGSDRQIVSPLAVLMHKTFALEQTIAQNDVVKALAQLADRAGQAGALVERVPATQLVGKMLSVEEVAKQLTKDDSITAADAQDLLTILSASIENGNYMTLFRAEQASDKGENILFFWEGGKVQAIQLKDGDTGADVVNMLNGLGRENMSLGMELIAGTSSMFRTAITSWPDFLIVNFIRDQMSAWILTDVGFTPFVTGLRGVGDEIRQKQWAQRANASMMIMGGMNVAALHEARVNRDINSLRGKGYIARVFNDGGVLGAVKGFGRIIELTETGTRLGLFRNAFERAKRDGLTDYEAGIEASYLATDYIDFGLNGDRMLMWRRTIPFLNAQLQGYYKLLRTLGADEVRQRHGLMFALGAFFKSTKNLPLSRTEKQAINTGRKAWIKMVSLGLLSALLHFLFEDDEDYQETSEYLRTTGWVIPVGDGRVFYIPKPFELAMVANATERALEYASGDTEAPKRFMRGAAMTMMPPTAPPVLQTLVEYAANKDFFSGREIVPDYMQALAPELQYNNYTSSFAKEIGQTLGWSPMVVDHFMNGLGASAYRDMVTMTDALDPNKPSMDATDAPIARRFIRDVRRGSASSRDFWAQASMTDGKLRGAEVTYRAYLEAGNQPAADRFLSTLSDDEKAYALLGAHFKAEYKRLNPMYRARQVNTVVAAMRRELVSELGLEDTSPFADHAIRMSPGQKNQIDQLLSEYARREMRNTLVAVGLPGWTGKRPLDTAKTIDMLADIVPTVRDELERRLAKAKVYDATQVFEAWPEARDRLIMDRDQAFLDDLVTLAKVAR